MDFKNVVLRENIKDSNFHLFDPETGEVIMELDRDHVVRIDWDYVESKANEKNYTIIEK